MDKRLFTFPHASAARPRQAARSAVLAIGALAALCTPAEAFFCFSFTFGGGPTFVYTQPLEAPMGSGNWSVLPPPPSPWMPAHYGTTASPWSQPWGTLGGQPWGGQPWGIPAGMPWSSWPYQQPFPPFR